VLYQAQIEHLFFFFLFFSFSICLPNSFHKPEKEKQRKKPKAADD
jgi:hypothetical protein